MLANRYSPVIRGQKVSLMPDKQVMAIYYRLADSNDAEIDKPVDRKPIDIPCEQLSFLPW